LADNYNPNSNVNDNSCIFDAVNSQLDSLNEINESGALDTIKIDLTEGWNMIGYPLNYLSDVEAAFYSISTDITNESEFPISIVKNVNGSFWAPEFGVKTLNNLIPGYGYMVYMNEEKLNFTFN